MTLEQIKKLTPFDRLIFWIREREQIRIRKDSGLPKPWSKYEIFQKYRFCNVRREDDKVTRWIAANWRRPHAKDPDLWFAMVVARLFNLPTTLEAVGYPVPWRSSQVAKLLTKRKADGTALFNGAYMVRNDAGMSKVDYVVKQVLDPMWDNKLDLRPTADDTLKDYHTRLLSQYGFGSFMAAQVVADMKYVTPLNEADDWDTFAASGPGSRRGLNRVMGKPVDSPWKESEWFKTISQLRIEVNRTLQWKISIHAQDINNCCCEFDKMERVLWGEGKPKQRYNGI